MTAKTRITRDNLLTAPWSPMTDRPRVGYPFMAPVIAKRTITNPHGVQYNARVLTNRPGTRWWIEVESDHWLRLYLTTTSKRVRDEWIAAVAA